MPFSVSNALTGSANINGLLSPVRWNTTTLSFSFPTSASFYGASYGGTEPDTFSPLNASIAAATRQALAFYSSVSGLAFTEVTETANVHGVIRSAYHDPGPGNDGVLAWAYFPSSQQIGGDVWYNGTGTDNVAAYLGNNDYATVMHELGHALGLKHPHEVDGAFPVLDIAVDYGDYTVMSYRATQGGELALATSETYGYSQTPMTLDIAAIQTMYGANFTTQSGNTVYRWSPTTGEMTINGVSQGIPGANRIYMSTWDGGGTDTYDLSNYTTALSVDLAPGAWSTFSQEQRAKLMSDGSVLALGNVSNALLYNNDTRSLIENIIGGSNNDLLVGNSAGNNLQGGAGNDSMHGMLGNDTFVGGGGADWLIGGDGLDTATYAAETSTVSINLLIGAAGTADGLFDTLVLIENVIGGSGADLISGDTLANNIAGGGNNDLLWSYAGMDTVAGDAGNDVVAAGEDNDFVFGGDGNDWLYGESGSDQLFGEAPSAGGFDVMIGGLGDDTLDGGLGGFDYFYGGDGVTGGGNDTFAVAAGSGFKVLNDFEAGGVNDAVRLTGTALTNYAQVQASLTFSGVINGMVLVVDGTTQVWFANVGLGQLTAGDFLFA